MNIYRVANVEELCIAWSDVKCNISNVQLRWENKHGGVN